MTQISEAPLPHFIGTSTSSRELSDVRGGYQGQSRLLAANRCCLHSAANHVSLHGIRLDLSSAVKVILEISACGCKAKWYMCLIWVLHSHALSGVAQFIVCNACSIQQGWVPFMLCDITWVICRIVHIYTVYEIEKKCLVEWNVLCRMLVW